MKKLILAALAALSFAAQAQTTGVVDKIAVVGTSPSGFQFTLVGNPGLCGGSANWGYIDETSFGVTLATNMKDKLTTSKLSGLTVSIWATLGTSPYNGMCRVTALQLN